MALRTCPKCELEIYDKAACYCPHCGNPAMETAGVQTGGEISTKGMLCIYLLFILFPIVLFLIHIFVPNM